MKTNKFLLATILLIFVQFSAVSRIQAQSRGKICLVPKSDFESPASSYKTINLQDVGIKIDIPANYKILKRDEFYEILDKASFDYFQCIRNGGISKGLGRGYVTQSVRRLNKNEFLKTIEASRKRQGIKLIPYKNNIFSGYLIENGVGSSISFMGSMQGGIILHVFMNCSCNLQAITELLSKIKPL